MKEREREETDSVAKTQGTSATYSQLLCSPLPVTVLQEPGSRQCMHMHTNIQMVSIRKFMTAGGQLPSDPHFFVWSLC